MGGENSLKVLVVDDNRDAANVTAMLLQRAHHCDARVVYRGASALDEARHYQPDVMLVDVGMPEIDGYDVAEQIRQCPELGAVVLAAVTGYADQKHREHASAVGFDEFMVKPVSFETMGRFLDTVRLSKQRQDC